MTTKLSYADLRLFLSVVVAHLFRPDQLMGPDSPMQVIERIERTEPGMAARAVREGVPDSISEILRGRVKDLNALKRQLAEVGAPSLASLLEKYVGKVERILKRGKIVKDEDFFLLREVIDLEELRPTRSALQALLDEYEFGGPAHRSHVGQTPDED